MGSIYEKNSGQKSRATVPLRPPPSPPYKRAASRDFRPLVFFLRESNPPRPRVQPMQIRLGLRREIRI
jgi:hypothetical protein